ncbi:MULTISPECIES: glycosyltransferase family 8 protein [unclassified Brenneria]|uniref:glycosyltransferase family 8 protein n=1 Tax=unclassified Brenneria TaxID=2634434 RepID=UPI0029C2BD2A|nr:MULTISPECIES: glycosyltransferase family 8 protein [unclassified Brenneria]MDX5629728.1 glycosyltransferase family 8 protein [Brenneria sp. L3-3Z]MDX5696874.1 glycosyltransferase family 8 protein [Brenneria sp. L4-2C]
MKTERFIKKKSIFNENSVPEFETLHIALCFDDGYAMPACVSAFSIIKNNPDINIVLHLFTLNVSKISLDRFKSLLANNLTIYNYEINHSFIDELTKDLNESSDSYWYLNKNRLSSACLRFIISDILKTITPKVLYMDCDTLCINSLSPLISLDISKFHAACIKDIAASEYRKLLFNNLDETYFNSGVMLINTEKWVSNKLTDKAIKLIIDDNGKFIWPDQDALNILMDGDIHYLPSKYNFMLQKDDHIPKDVIILHFAANPKPWFKIRNNKTYIEYLSSSPCKNVKLKLYDKETSNRYVLKTYSEELRKEGKIIPSIFYYLMYKITKFFYKK